MRPTYAALVVHGSVVQTIAQGLFGSTKPLEPLAVSLSVANLGVQHNYFCCLGSIPSLLVPAYLATKAVQMVGYATAFASRLKYWLYWYLYFPQHKVWIYENVKQVAADRIVNMSLLSTINDVDDSDMVEAQAGCYGCYLQRFASAEDAVHTAAIGSGNSFCSCPKRAEYVYMDVNKPFATEESDVCRL